MASRRQQSRKTADLAAAADPLLAGGEDAASENLLIFQLAGESFALRLASIAEIIRLPDLAHMPLVPPSLLGLANLRGIVLPVISLRALLQLPGVETNEQTRVDVIRGDAAVGFVVDRIDRLLALAAHRLEQDVAGAGTTDPALLDGTIKGSEGQSTIKLLNPSRLLSGQFGRLGVSTPHAATRSAVAIGSSAATPAQTLISLLSFRLGEQEYALPLDHVREIFPLPGHVSNLPRPETAVLGVITLRDRLLPLVSLRALLGMAADSGLGPRGKVVVVSLGDGAVGVVVDATREILRVDPDIIEPAPALLTRGDGDAEITSICRLEDGQRLVALLSPDRLFRSELVRRILSEQASAGETEPQSEANLMADEQFIIFRMGDQDYGIPIAAVSEIARRPDHITRLPKAPAFVDGVMNLRGSVVPIVDLRRRFDLSTTEHAGSQRILMVTIGAVITGFLVDSVSEIMKVQTDAIQPAPELSADQMRLISRVINLEAWDSRNKGRMVLLVDPAQLLDQVEADVLAKFRPSERDVPVTVP
jgi:purine-binding chemotaxis protein CheW